MYLSIQIRLEKGCAQNNEDAGRCQCVFLKRIRHR